MGTQRTDDRNETAGGQSTENRNTCKGMGEGKQVRARRAARLMADEYQTLIDTPTGGGDGGAAGTAGAAEKKGPMEPCALGKESSRGQ